MLKWTAERDTRGVFRGGSPAADPKKSPLFTNRALARLMIPLVIEQLLLMTVGMADTMMVTSFDAGVDLLVQGSAVAPTPSPAPSPG